MSLRKDLDRIYTNREELLNLMAWKNDNVELVRDFPDVLKEGLIFSGNKQTAIYFKVDGGFVEYCYYYKETLTLHALVRRTHKSYYTVEKIGNTKDYQVKKNGILYRCVDKERPCETEAEIKAALDQLLFDNTVVHAAIMAYMAYCQSEVIIDETPFMKPSREKKAKRHNRFNPDHPIKIKRKVVRLHQPTYKKVTEKERRKIDKTFPVRGHWRHYKSGKTAWIEPYTKGKGKRKPATYTL